MRERPCVGRPTKLGVWGRWCNGCAEQGQCALRVAFSPAIAMKSWLLARHDAVHDLVDEPATRRVHARRVALVHVVLPTSSLSKGRRRDKPRPTGRDKPPTG